MELGKGGWRGRGRKGRRGEGRPSWENGRRCRNGPCGGGTHAAVGSQASVISQLPPAVALL